ncbi:MAG: EamA family transporter, partial [Xanthomonadales bacterium]|nr:EamA family transporter [Xanthomonadales bacterium]
MPGLINLWQAAPPVMRGIMLMCVSTVLFSAMHVLVRFVAQDVPPLQVAFLRNIFGVIVFLPLLMSTGLGFMRTERLGLHSVR